MIDSGEEEKIEDVSYGPAAIMLAFSGWLAVPTLWFAWNHDRYSRGGMWAFGIWLLALIFLWYRGRAVRKPSTVLWLMGAVLCCSLGGIFSVNLLYHGGFCMACLALLQPYVRSIFFVFLALTWMPATGWLVSRVMAGGFVGWERPLTVLLLCGVLVYGLVKKMRCQVA